MGTRTAIPPLASFLAAAPDRGVRARLLAAAAGLSRRDRGVPHSVSTCVGAGDRTYVYSRSGPVCGAPSSMWPDGSLERAVGGMAARWLADAEACLAGGRIGVSVRFPLLRAVSGVPGAAAAADGGRLRDAAGEVVEILRNSPRCEGRLPLTIEAWTHGAAVRSLARLLPPNVVERGHAVPPDLWFFLRPAVSRLAETLRPLLDDVSNPVRVAFLVDRNEGAVNPLCHGIGP